MRARCILGHMKQQPGRHEVMDAREDGSPPGLLSIGQVVANLQTDFPDVSHSSLRFLEREGFLTPQRTPGGHRVFTQQDVERIRQIKRWQEQRLSLEEIRERLATVAANPLDELTQRLTGELLEAQPAAVPALLNADDLGVPLPVLFQDVLQRVQFEVGQRWQQGGLRVGQEHEITEMLREAIAQLSWRHAAPPQGPPMLAACAPGEDHDLGLRMVVALLRARGRHVHFLGAHVDGHFLYEEIRIRLPAVVLLSATLPARLAALELLLADLRQDASTRDIPVVVGGGIVQTMSVELSRFGAIPDRSADLNSAVERIMQLSEGQPARCDTLALTVW